MRMTVKDVLEYMAGGTTGAGILEHFPNLEPEDIRACLAFAVERMPRHSRSDGPAPGSA